MSWPGLKVEKFEGRRNRMTTKAERDYMGRVAALPCVVCGSEPVQLHHVREGQGMAQRAQNWLVIPLCPSCHTGPRGIHGDKSVLRQIKKDEIDLLAETIGAMNAQTR